MAEFAFRPIKMREWLGRYHKPAGKESVYHVDSAGVIEVHWRDGGLKFDCPVISSPGAKSMARAINEAKSHETGWPGGSFTINEFSQVICPVQASSKRYWVGNASGTLWFLDPWDGHKRLTLDVAAGYRCGDPWKLPYLGMKYNLRRDDRIYFWRQTMSGGQSEYLQRQDANLVRVLRCVRPYGPMSFIVNQYGIVVAKREDKDGWEPVFVGRIDLNKWFEKET